jgi:hypothetical protein
MGAGEAAAQNEVLRTFQPCPPSGKPDIEPTPRDDRSSCAEHDSTPWCAISLRCFYVRGGRWSFRTAKTRFGHLDDSNYLLTDPRILVSWVRLGWANPRCNLANREGASLSLCSAAQRRLGLALCRTCTTGPSVDACLVLTTLPNRNQINGTK